MNHDGGAAIFYGTKDVLICGCYVKTHGYYLKKT